MTTAIGFPNRISKDQFTFIKLIGRGGYGKVYLVKKDTRYFAMKVLDKKFIQDKNLRVKTHGK